MLRRKPNSSVARAVLFLVAVCCGVLLLPSFAVAVEGKAPAQPGPTAPRGKTPQAQASALFKESQELRKANDFRGALAKLEEAYQILPTPTLLFPIAELRLAVSLPIEGLAALAHYKQDMAPSEMEPGQQLADIDRLEAKMREKLAYLRPTAPAGARIVLDGNEIGKAPIPERVEVNPGVHRLSASSEKGNTEATVEVHAGQDAEVFLLEEKAPPEKAKGYFPHPITWAAIGLSTAFLFATTVLGGMVINETKALDGVCSNHLCISTGSQDLMNLNSQVNTQRSHATAAAAVVSLATIFTVGTAVLIVFDWQRQKAGRTLLTEHRLGSRLSLYGPVPAVSSDGAGFALGGRF